MSSPSSGASLAGVRIIDPKSFSKSGIDVIHKHSSNIDEIFFEVVERVDCIEEGCVINLRGEAMMITVLVDITLEDVVQHVMRLEHVPRDKHLEKLLMDSGGGKTDDPTLQFAIGHRAFGSARDQVKAWLEEVVRSVLMGSIQDIVLDGLDSQSTQICGTSKGGEAIRIASSINQVDGVLGELDIIFPPQRHVWRRINSIQIGVIKGKLHPNKFYTWSTAGIGRAVLNWEEN